MNVSSVFIYRFVTKLCIGCHWLPLLDSGSLYFYRSISFRPLTPTLLTLVARVTNPLRSSTP